jgi:hypothetical protein
MPSTIGPALAASADTTIRYAERLATGIPAADFGRLARPGGVVIQSNHPAFVYGHLAIYPSRILSQLGLDVGTHAVDEAWMKRFSKDADCQDDPDGTIYPAMSILVRRVVEGYRSACDALLVASDEQLLQPNPIAAMIDRFPTMAAMHGFYVGGHAMIHFGQVSAWRRMQQLGPA